MNERFSPEQQVAALLDMVDELDPWTSKFVQGLNEWVQRGRRLTDRQREVLQDKFDEYDPLWLNERRRWDATHELLGKFVTAHEAIALLKDRLATLDAADARFMHRVMLLSADGGGVTERAAKRLFDVFTRAGLWPMAMNLADRPSPPPNPPPRPRPKPATVLEFRPGLRPRKADAAEAARAMAELFEFKGRLH
jgi:hypothetical protein